MVALKSMKSITLVSILMTPLNQYVMVQCSNQISPIASQFLTLLVYQSMKRLAPKRKNKRTNQITQKTLTLLLKITQIHTPSTMMMLTNQKMTTSNNINNQ
jgi:hypothetical protein